MQNTGKRDKKSNSKIKKSREKDKGIQLDKHGASMQCQLS